MTRRLVRSPHALWRRVGQGLVVVGAEGEPVTVAGCGAALWEVLAEPTGDDEIAALLADAFGVEAAVVAEDVRPVLDDLLARGLVLEVTGDDQPAPVAALGAP